MSASHENQSPTQPPVLPAYQYSPLPENHTRLIQLMPHPDHNASIRCQLITYPVISRKRGSHVYDALSYVWGPPPNTCQIEVIDRLDSSSLGVLSIRENCHAALLRLRDPILPRFIWIDSICINQESNDDKSRQIQVMAQIYALASCVIVWLRDPVAVHSDGLEVSQPAGTGLGDTAYSSRWFEIIGAAADFRSANPTGTYELEDEGDICDLLHRCWFRRIWVLQEVAAARQIVIMDSHDEMDGDCFCLGLEALDLEDITMSPRNALRPVHTATLLMKGAGLRSRMSRGIRTMLGTRSIVEMVNTFHFHEATDRRDKVFALLGLSQDVPMELSANYDTSWKDVFHQLTKSCISDSQAYIETWDNQEIAIMKTKVRVLGHFHLGGNKAETLFPVRLSGGEATWNRKWTALCPKRGDILCSLAGASSLTIIRPLKHQTFVYWAVISIVESPGDALSTDVDYYADYVDDYYADPAEDHVEDYNEDYDEDWYAGFAEKGRGLRPELERRLKYIQQNPLFMTECCLVWDWGIFEADISEDSASEKSKPDDDDIELSTGISKERMAAHIELMARSKIWRLPETFEEIASTYENYGRLLALAGRQNDAHYILKTLMRNYDQVTGPTNHQKVAALHRISEIYRESKDRNSEDSTSWSAEVIGRSGRCVHITEDTLLYCLKSSGPFSGRRLSTLCKYRENEVSKSVTQAVLEAVVELDTTTFGLKAALMDILLQCIREEHFHDINTVRLVELTAQPNSHFDSEHILSLMIRCEYINNTHDEGVREPLEPFEDVVDGIKCHGRDINDLKGVVEFILERLKDRIAPHVKQRILVKAAGTRTNWPEIALLLMSKLLDQWGDDIIQTEEVIMAAVVYDHAVRDMMIKLLHDRYGPSAVEEPSEMIKLSRLTRHRAVAVNITGSDLEAAAEVKLEFKSRRRLKNTVRD